MMSTYVGCVASDQLKQLADEYIEFVASEEARPDAQRVSTIMNLFIDELINAFLLAPLDFLDLSKTSQKVVQLTSFSIKKTSAGAINRSAKKMDLAQHKLAADYIDATRFAMTDEHGVETWYASFPLTPTLAMRVKEGINLAEQEGARQHIKLLTKNLLDLNEAGIAHFVESPLEILGFSGWLMRIIELALATIKKAINAVTNKVFVKMEEHQLQACLGYMDTLIIEGPEFEFSS